MLSGKKINKILICSTVIFQVCVSGVLLIFTRQNCQISLAGNRATIKSTRCCCTMSKITPCISRLFQLFIPWDFWQGRWKTCTRFLTSTQNISALNYAQDFGTTVKESLKWTRKNSKWATLTKSRIQTRVKYFHAFVSSLNYVSPIVANSVWQRSIRSE